MDFQSAMETFAEAWVAANTGTQTQALALTARSKSPPLPPPPPSSSAPLPPTLNVPHQSTNLKEESPSPPHSIRDSTRSPSEMAVSPKQQQQQQQQHQLQHSLLQHHHQQQQQQVPHSAVEAAAAINHHFSPSLSMPTNLTTSAGKVNTGSSVSINENGVQSHSDRVMQSPVIDRKEFDFSKVNAKSLPLHCVVESVQSLQASYSHEVRSPWKRRPNIETDSYVIVPAATPFADIVNTALQRLGYSADVSSTARGSILIKNWKSLPLENISDSPVLSVGDILGELTSVVTLRIVILRTKPSAMSEIKDKLLKLLILQSHAVLRSTGCPLDEMTLTQICRNPYQNSFPFPPELSEEVRRKFDHWWSNQLTPQASPLTPKILPFINPQPTELDFPTNHHLHASRESLLDNHHPPHHNMIVHPALQTVHSQYPNQKTRMRTSFDPEMELPKLQRWFQENPHPTRQQIQSYVIQLNSLESRRGRKPLDVNNVVYWFKNARAAQKRAEVRGQSGLGNGYSHPQSGLMMPHSDYMKSPHSLPSEDIDNMSQHSDDMDDDSDRPSSPQGPLSLTTHERNRSSSAEELSVKLESIQSNGDDTPIKNNNTTPNGTSEDLSECKSNKHDCSSDNLDVSERNEFPKNSSPQSDDDLDMDDNDINPIDDFRSPSPDGRRDLPFSMVPNSMFSHSIMYMRHYIPSAMGQGGHHALTPNASPESMNSLNLSNLSNDERRKRNRTFIDPVTEVPKLEQWFAMNTHPSHNLILKYTEDLNRMPYRYMQKFPRLESKNVQFWFKNRRAKCKRLKMSLYDPSQLAAINSFPHSDRD